ncbi:MAG: hypothetical protein JSW07_02415 [bacterium]|nr:MAG: hypothetical protein JSW07_02415 [bacterium]
MSNICVANGVAQLDEMIEAVIYIGGIPKIKTAPLNYQAVYSLQSVFNAYNRPALIFRQGTAAEVEPLSGMESINFAEPIGKLEAFYTDGLGPLMLTMKGKITSDLGEKTLHYPGFADRVKFLKSCGLLEDKPVLLDSTEIVPLDLLVHQLAPKLKLGPEGDWLVMRVIVKGIKDAKKQTHIFELIDEFDAVTQYTAMARTTGFPATYTARMIVNGLLSEKGVQFPEQIFIAERYDSLLSNLAGYGIQIIHKSIDSLFYEVHLVNL